MKDVSKEVIALKKFYGISNGVLHLISGIGINQIAKYEKGEIPSKSNYLLIHALLNINAFKVLFYSCKDKLSKTMISKMDFALEHETKIIESKVEEYKSKLMNISITENQL